MNKTIILLISGVFVLLSGCSSHSGNPAIELGKQETLYKNPNPKIEALHVKAFNYDLGIGVKQNRAKANVLYLQAAKAGDPRSMMNYAINRYSGKGIDANPNDAFNWINKARFTTQNSRDMKLKWRVRSVYDDMKKELKKKSP